MLATRRICTACAIATRLDLAVLARPEPPALAHPVRKWRCSCNSSPGTGTVRPPRRRSRFAFRAPPSSLSEVADESRRSGRDVGTRLASEPGEAVNSARVSHTTDQPSRRRPIPGLEIAAEMPATDLVAALPSMLPSGWICGVDAVTQNTAHVFARPRERCASLEIDVGQSDFSVRDLEGGAQALSRRRAARVVLWDESDAIYFVEMEAGAPIARLARSHAGDYRGIDWQALSAGAVAPPFPAQLVPLLAAWRDAEFVDGLLRWQHGSRRPRGEPVAQIFRHYVTREPSPALRAVFRAALRRARATGSALLRGFGRLLWRATDGGVVAVRPARSLLRFFDGGGAPALDFSIMTTRLGAAAVAQAEHDVADALAAARESDCDVVFPELLCITTRTTPAFESTNPRDGSPFIVPGHRLPFFILDGPAPGAASRASETPA